MAKNIKYQNILILVASYFFYGWWDWRFLSLIFANSLIDYFAALQIYNLSDKGKKRIWLGISLLFNLGMLGLFKYFDFFSNSLAELVGAFGVEVDPILLNLVLPIGISFYTFQTMSYSIDIYKGRIKPTNDLIDFLAYVSFFPQLVAGPIERASNILPQFSKQRVFKQEEATDGMRQILWGLFKKVVIADNCALYVDHIYSNHLSLSGIVLIIGVVLFVYQVYCDFSGYSDIAIGTAKLFGINLMQNFEYPYFSKNMTEFYRRWHISLSTWIRDYLFTPLSLELRGLNKRYRYIVVFIITFTFFGFWHGANWTFIVFGILQGIILSYEHASRKWRKKMTKSSISSLYSFGSIILTFATWCFSCLIFRATSMTEAVQIFTGIFTFDDYFNLSNLKVDGSLSLQYVGLLIFGFMLVEWLQKNKPHGLVLHHIPQPLRWSIYLGLMILITNYGIVVEIPFIYFQF